MGIAVLPAAAVVSAGVVTLGLDEPWAHRDLVLCAADPAALSSTAHALAEHLTGWR